MTLPVYPNRISLLDIGLEYPSQNGGAVQPLKLSNYYRNGSLVPNSNQAPQTNIPTRPGSPYPEIKFSNFHGTSKFFRFNDTLTVNTADYNLKAKALEAGWDGIRPIIASVTVNSGVILYASTTSSYAFRVGSDIPYTFPANSSLRLVNNGYIIGKGGAGGAGGAGAGSSSLTFTSSSEQSLTVPAGVTSINFQIIGGGGGGGGSDDFAGYPGYDAGIVTGTIAVTPGDVLKFSAGGGGGGGRSNVSGGGHGASPAGAGGVGYYTGGTGGKPGTRNTSGAGGGGGGASVIRLNDIVKVVAGGGGGGGGGGLHSRGQPAQNIQAVTNNGTVGQDKGSGNDGGGGGGGGGGYLGGEGGTCNAGDYGANSGTSGQNYAGTAVTVTGGLNNTAAGTGGSNSTNKTGDSGQIIISYHDTSGVGISGSNGGAALYIDSAITVQNNGVIAGGGGGGGGGGSHPSSNDGAGGGGGGGIQPGGPKGWHAEYSATYWWQFMNDYAIWKGPHDQHVATYIFDKTVYFPVTDTYTFYLSADNLGTVSIDGTQLLSTRGFNSYVTVSRTVTAGYHTVTGKIINEANAGVPGTNPGGIAIQIKKSNGSELWNTRKLLYTSPEAWGGAGGAGGVSIGNDGLYGSGGTYVAGNGGIGGNETIETVGLGGNGGALGQPGEAGQTGSLNGVSGLAGGAGGAAGKAVAYGNSLASWEVTGSIIGVRS